MIVVALGGPLGSVCNLTWRWGGWPVVFGLDCSAVSRGSGTHAFGRRYLRRFAGDRRDPAIRRCEAAHLDAVYQLQRRCPTGLLDDAIRGLA